MSIFESLVVPATLIFQQLRPINSLLAPLCASSLAILLITKGTAVLTSSLIVSSSLDMLSLMKTPFLCLDSPPRLVPRSLSSLITLILYRPLLVPYKCLLLQVMALPHSHVRPPAFPHSHVRPAFPHSHVRPLAFPHSHVRLRPPLRCAQGPRPCVPGLRLLQLGRLPVRLPATRLQAALLVRPALLVLGLRPCRSTRAVPDLRESFLLELSRCRPCLTNTPW